LAERQFDLHQVRIFDVGLLLNGMRKRHYSSAIDENARKTHKRKLVEALTIVHFFLNIYRVDGVEVEGSEKAHVTRLKSCRRSLFLNSYITGILVALYV
jgi:hypothetical protein